MNYYDEIKNKIIDNEIYIKVKDYSKERNTVITNFEIGKLLYEAGNKYGESVIDNYAKKLTAEVGKKYNRRTLFRMRQFYLMFNDQKVSPLATQLTWSHYTELLSLKDETEIMYYINRCIKDCLSKRELREIIKTDEYGRLPDKTKEKLLDESYEQMQVQDFIKNPIMIKNLNNYEIISEKVLQRLVLEDIPSFLKELGSGFTFIDNEYKIKIGDRFNYIDLLLFNYEYNCFVVIELKVTELKKEYIGQVQIYMNYIDRNLKMATQDKTIGIIICKRNNKYIMEYCSDKRILAKEYELV